MDIAQPNVKELLELLTKEVYEVPQEKSYWLIRTQGGILYDAFKQECVVSIEHSVPLRIIQVFAEEYGSSKKAFTDAIKEYMMEGKDKSLFSSAELHGFGLKASQIYNFYFELKKGDIIIIPAENSDEFTFGQIIKTQLNAYNVDDAMRVGIASGMFKDFKYIKTIKKNRLDPLLFKAFSSHQAISKLTMDPSVVERSIRDIFVSNDLAHFIIDIESENTIPANDIFGLGNYLLEFIDGFSKYHNLDFDSSAFGININLNSPGKIDLKSHIKTATILAGIILFVVGGEVEIGEGKDKISVRTKGVPGILQAVSDYRDNEFRREMTKNVYEKYKDSLKIKNPEDIVILMKQVESKQSPSQ